ncbi:hypothetical protein [Candidatus Williamhamiltonella defendens]|uniref:hypothetical protein n=1 Tax=Candidatus Williamhamiltonella defendens TaxID=138072 RepID=UPI001C9DA51F|nr:hypothetical protein [Candidatus Hamiltonella defensa]
MALIHTSTQIRNDETLVPKSSSLVSSNTAIDLTGEAKIIYDSLKNSQDTFLEINWNNHRKIKNFIVNENEKLARITALMKNLGQDFIKM